MSLYCIISCKGILYCTRYCDMYCMDTVRLYGCTAVQYGQRATLHVVVVMLELDGRGQRVRVHNMYVRDRCLSGCEGARGLSNGGRYEEYIEYHTF